MPLYTKTGFDPAAGPDGSDGRGPGDGPLLHEGHRPGGRRADGVLDALMDHFQTLLVLPTPHMGHHRLGPAGV